MSEDRFDRLERNIALLAHTLATMSDRISASLAELRVEVRNTHVKMHSLTRSQTAVKPRR